MVLIVFWVLFIRFFVVIMFLRSIIFVLGRSESVCGRFLFLELLVGIRFFGIILLLVVVFIVLIMVIFEEFEVVM